MQMFLAQASEVVGPMEGQPLWAQISYVVLMALVTMFLVPYLKRLAEKARADADASGQSAKDTLLNRLKQLALDQAAVIAERRFPDIAAKLLKKKMSAEEVKAELRTWGQELKVSLVDYFKREGIDLVEVLGDKMLDDVIRWAADKTSPFPGKDTAVTLLVDDWSNKLVKFGVDWVRNHWLEQKAA